MHFSALKFQYFLGEHAPRKRPPRKGVLMSPLSMQLFAVSILTSWLLETVLSCCLCRFVIFFFQVFHVMLYATNELDQVFKI